MPGIRPHRQVFAGIVAVILATLPTVGWADEPETDPSEPGSSPSDGPPADQDDAPSKPGAAAQAETELDAGYTAPVLWWSRRPATPPR